DLSRDQIESEEYDLFAEVHFFVQRNIVREVNIGRINVGDHDFRIHLMKRLNGFDHTLAHRHHDLAKASPRASIGRPPTDAAAIPCGNSWLIKWGVPMQPALVARG